MILRTILEELHDKASSRDYEREDVISQIEQEIKELMLGKDEIKNIIINSKYKQIFQDSLINAGFPGDTYKLGKDLAHAIHLAMLKKLEE